MKRILIALALVLSLQVADAQVKPTAAIKKAVEGAEAAAQDPKKNIKPTTWLKLAEAYVNAYTNPAGIGWIGASKQELQMLMAGKQPLSVEQVEVAGKTFTKEVYETCNYYFNSNGLLEIIEVTAPVYEDALENARVAYAEAAKVDVKQTKIKDVKAGLEDLARKYTNDAFNCYQFGNLAGASVLFEKAAKAAATEPLNKIDTTAVYNAGFTAWMVQDYERAKTFFLACLDVPYYHDDGEVFSKLADVYAKLGDKALSAETLEKGFTLFPQSQSILIGLINYYLENNENADRLFELIAMAKQNEPDNASLYYVEGNIYKELGNVEKAVAAYYQCADINPAYEFGYIGAGVLYYELAVKLSEEASNEYDDAKYNALVEQFEKALMDAIDPFEKAFEVTKDNNLKVSIAEYLKNIYYRFYSKGEQYEAGYKKYDDIVKNGIN